MDHSDDVFSGPRNTCLTKKKQPQDQPGHRSTTVPQGIIQQLLECVALKLSSDLLMMLSAILTLNFPITLLYEWKYGTTGLAHVLKQTQQEERRGKDHAVPRPKFAGCWLLRNLGALYTQ